MTKWERGKAKFPPATVWSYSTDVWTPADWVSLSHPSEHQQLRPQSKSSNQLTIHVWYFSIVLRTWIVFHLSTKRLHCKRREGRHTLGCIIDHSFKPINNKQRECGDWIKTGSYGNEVWKIVDVLSHFFFFRISIINQFVKEFFFLVETF